MTALVFDLTMDDARMRKMVALGEQALAKAAKPELTVYARRVHSRVARERFGTATGPKTLKARSGNLRNTLFHRVEGSTLSDMAATMGSHAIYGPAHEFGRPAGKPPGAKGKHAAIPVADGLTKAGVARGKPRDFTGTYVIPRRGGGWLMFGEVGSKVGLLFVLIPWDQIKALPPRLGIYDTMRDEMPRFGRSLVRAMVKGLEAAA